MRVLVARLFVLAALTPIFAMRVDGILVHGRTNDVSRADIREALATEPMAHPSEVVVLSSSEMRIYFGTHDEGWSPMVRGPVIEPSGKTHIEWHLSHEAKALEDRPEVFRLIRSASEVYVFPVTTPLKPRRDDKHLRLLQGEARRKLVRLLGNEKNWFHGFDNTFWPDKHIPRNVGFVFRNGRDELVLFCTLGWKIEATLNGQRTGGSLKEASSQKMENWKKQYAQPELAMK